MYHKVVKYELLCKKAVLFQLKKSFCLVVILKTRNNMNMLRLKIKLENLGSSHFCGLFWSSVLLTLAIFLHEPIWSGSI